MNRRGKYARWSVAFGVAISGCGGNTGAEPVSAIAMASEDEPSPNQVETTEGIVQGVAHEGYQAFLGIPYAAPPTGSLRWKSPTRPAEYDGVYDATHFRSACPQLTIAGPVGSEDCLYLNIFRPTPSGVPVRDAPVIVWIHGGGYSSGTGNAFDLSSLATSQGIVAVTINYRLGALGYLSHPALSAEESPRRSGNYGIQDMQAALRWVRKNIKRFGGDNKNVTAVGESAGGNAVYMMLASLESEDLFDKAVAQSGAYLRNQPSLPAAEASGVALAATKYNCTLDAGEAGAATCLRSLPLATVLTASVTQPIVDGKILVETTPSAFAGGRFNRVPVMAGSTHNEGTFFTSLLPGPMTPDNYTSFGTLNVPPSEVAIRYPAAAFPTPEQALAEAVGDYHMFCGAMRDVDSISSYVPDTYFYDWDDPNPASAAAFAPGYPGTNPRINMLAYHAGDVVYWFGLILPADHTPARDGLSSSMMGYLGNFARTGRPDSAGGVTWRRYDQNARPVMHLGYPLNPTYDAFQAHQCAFWYSAPPSQSLF
jgi:para-nitrobenzyl esterase